TLLMSVLEPPVRQAYDIESREGLLFVGGFTHSPNTDAMLWFAEEVFPKILAQYPDMVLHIVGNKPPREVEDLASENIIVHGFVSEEHLDELYNECRLAIAPLRYGAGMKGKVIEAMEKGVPMVTTDIGAEGLSNSSNMLEIANEADEFAAAVCRLYDNADRISQMREAGYDYIEEHFSRESAWEVLKKAINMSRPSKQT
ncbi:MAG: glycosyltransferase, partial [Clostridiales bacterium]|nr:glycosyltransferase [Clostridiales bacterium]